jgi:type IV pilus assembly protein PilB
MGTPEADSSKLVDALLARKLLDSKRLNQIVETQQKSGKGILHALGETGAVAPEALLEVVSVELGVVPLRLSRVLIPPEVAALVPKKLVHEHQIVPVSKLGDILTAATADPLNKAAFEEIQQATGLHVVPVVSGRREIQDAIEASYPESSTSDALRDAMKDIEAMDMTLVETKEEVPSANLPELLNLTAEEPVVKLTDHILTDGVRRRASDIFVEPQERELVIRYRVDGVLQEGPRPPRSVHRGIVSRIKIMSNLDIAEHRLPQDGRCKLSIQNRSVDFRISTIPTYYGEKVCLRILDPSQVKLDIRKLGLDEKSLDRLLKAVARPYGMILTCGPTGSGKTTTLYSLLARLNGPERNIVTIEDPVEFAIPGINQVNTRADVGLTFAAALRSVLRQDPNVVLVGEIRDAETADIGIKAALTGHLVLSTLHTNTAVGCVTRLVNMGVEPFLITSSLILAASQRLVRVVCKECQEGYKASPELKKSLGIKEAGDVTLYRAKGCDRCQRSGYAGRICIIEAFTMTPKVRELIMQRATEDQIKAAARRDGMMTLRENALQKLLEGATTAEEVLRLTMPDEPLEAKK